MNVMRGNVGYQIIALERKLWKGGSAMDIKVNIDWKSILALGGSIVVAIFAVKMDTTTAKEVLIHAIDTTKEYVIACNTTV